MKHIALYLLFAFTATLILLNRFTDLYVNDYRVHFILLLIAAASFVLIVGKLFGKLQTNKSMVITILIVAVIVYVRAFLTWPGDWKTDKILFRNIQNPDKTVQTQLRGDRFNFGYKKRLIETKPVAPFMEWTTDIDTTHMDPKQWQRLGTAASSTTRP